MPRFDTRLALMRAAEQLFAQQGVDRVSLREIAVAAGQRNVSAATYHFGSKRELIEAILDRHAGPIHEGWLSALQGARQRLDLRQLIELMVRPNVAKIDDPDGGRCFLELCADLVTSRSFPLIGMRAATSPGATALCSGISELGPHLSSDVAALRGSRLAAILYTSIADYLRVTDGGVDIPREALIADLTNVLVSAVRAPAPDVAPMAEASPAAAVARSKLTEIRAE